MKAAVYHGRGDVRVEERPEPQVRPGTLKLKVDWCGICGTDLHEYEEGPIFVPPPGHPHPITGETLPLILGHEFAGTVAEIGPGVSGEDDPLALPPHRGARAVGDHRVLAAGLAEPCGDQDARKRQGIP